MFTVLVCDDDAAILESLRIYLSQEGYRVLCARDGLEALEQVQGEEIHCMVLDIMMPRLDGLKTTLKLREKYNFPIILLSAKSEDTDKIAGLGFGADDYVTKPFNPLEVVARVNTQLRRAGHYNQSAAAPEDAAEYDIRRLIINRESHNCALYGRELALTPIEFSILWYLCSRQGRVVPSEELFEAVWKEKYLQNSNNTVMAHIARLREKMNEPPRNPIFIKTGWGVGYEIE